MDTVHHTKPQTTDPASRRTTDNLRKCQRPNPQGCQGPWTLSDRGRGLEMRVSGHHEPRPERHRPQALVQPMEGSTECLRDNVRRTAVCRTKVVRNQSITPFSGQTRRWLKQAGCRGLSSYSVPGIRTPRYICTG